MEHSGGRPKFDKSEIGVGSSHGVFNTDPFISSCGFVNRDGGSKVVVATHVATVLCDDHVYTAN